MLALLADKIDLTGAWKDGLEHTRQRRCEHPPGRVFYDVDVDPALAQRMSLARPDLPEDPSAERVEA